MKNKGIFEQLREVNVYSYKNLTLTKLEEVIRDVFGEKVEQKVKKEEVTWKRTEEKLLKK